ncbi:MAG: D-alanyl-D-alanine carboxypeptidase [Clostridiales bacterium]|nr:D-alanyl-D-alanine carboxypeptidase [Clostridiales bacterium]
MRNKIKSIGLRLLSVVMVFNILTVPLSASATEASSTKSESSQSTESASDFVWPTGPDVYADGAIVMEASTGLVLYEKDAKTAYYPASITKIMTTLLALENCNLNETMTMSHEAEWDVDFNSSRIGLVEGESVSLKDALYAVMLESANEVSYGVAEHVANGTEADFAAMMNAKAAELGCVNTHFVNPHGLHNNDHYTCAYDMALISREAIQNPEFRTITGTRTYTIPATNKNVARPIANHHRFIRKTLNYDGAIGGKTGGTAEAKTTLVTFAERNGLTLIAVVLHVDTALHAYEDTAKMLDFAFDNYSLYSMEDTNQESSSFRFPSLFKDFKEFNSRDISKLSLSKNSNVVLPLKANIKDAVKTITYSKVDEFQHGNNVIGKISYTFGGKYVGSTDILYYNDDFPLTRAEFNAQWPSYLIPPELVFNDDPSINTETENGNELDSSNSKNEKEPAIAVEGLNAKKASKVKPIIIGVCIGAIVLVIGYYLLFIEIPHRKRRSRYRKNHQRRMDSIRSNNDSYL